jgi:outer membrane protein assembly factor BamB
MAILIPFKTMVRQGSSLLLPGKYDQIRHGVFPFQSRIKAIARLSKIVHSCRGWNRTASSRRSMNARFLVFLAFLLSAATPCAAQSSRFESLGTPVRVGGLMGCIVGPDGQGGEALYFNLNQAAAPLFIVQVNPDTGQARQFNAPQGPGAWAFMVGPDEKIYLGTWESGWLLQFDPKQPDQGIVNLGKPAESESYLWQFALGADGNLYSCTYPNAKLVRFDPRTGQKEDLGRMHPTEMYARSVAAGKDGWIYVGIGTQQGDLVAYNPATRQHHSVLTPALRAQLQPGPDTGSVSKRRDGHVYGFIHGKIMRLENGKAVLVESAPEPAPLHLRDGREVTVFERGRFVLRNPKNDQTVERKFSYAGAGDLIFVVGVGPGGAIYGSTAMPLEVFRFHPATRQSEHLGNMPGGEVYSMLPHDGKLYLCYYGGSVMNLYDPAKPFWKFGSAPDCNPISFGGLGDGHLRPRAMIRGPEGLIYVGSEPPYGQLGGAMAVWDPKQNRVIENHRHIITNQSIVSLAFDPGTGLIFGGSGNFGGGGTRPTEKEAKFFAFDPTQKKKVFETSFVPGARNYPATCVADGKVFTTAGSQLFVINPRTFQLEKTIALPGGQIEISLDRHASGKLVGLTSSAVYILDPEKAELAQTHKAPVPIRCGFALTKESVFFGSGSELWRFQLD